LVTEPGPRFVVDTPPPNEASSEPLDVNLAIARSLPVREDEATPTTKVLSSGSTTSP
jgi:hypothetical protein